MYKLSRHDEGLSLREDDGSGYPMRAAELGQVAATWICCTGQTVNEVIMSPEKSPTGQPEIARVPGIGAALGKPAHPPDATGSTPGRL